MLASPLLENRSGYVGGRWAGAASGETFEVRNPASGDLLAAVPAMGCEETAAAIEAAAAAVRETEVPLDERRSWLAKIHDGLMAHRDEFARIITSENGKPLRESAAEVEYAAGFFGFFAGQLHNLAPREIPGRMRGCRWTVWQRPVGVAALITPWNFPLAMLAKKLAGALGAGASAVIKPARQTPLAAIALMALIERLGIPPGRCNLVVGKAQPIGDALCSHPDVRLVSFTGSTATGALLIEKTAPHVKRLALELGGNAPFIVFDDADILAARDGLIANKFRASGQTCVCTNRVYVGRRIAERFTEAVVERVAALTVGDGMAAETDIGPLIDRDGFDKVAGHVADALARGATRLVGSDPPRPANAWGAFYPPAVLTGVTEEMLVCREETFGPVVAISVFETEEEAIEAANGTPYGLAAYLYTADPARAERVARRLAFGHIGINTGTGPTPEAPFGGMKRSGFGREGGIEGLLEYCEPQTVARA